MGEAMREGLDVCPDLETIAAYLDRRLPERLRDEMAAHLTSCETCYFVFTEAVQMRVSQREAVESVPVSSRIAALVGGWRVPRPSWRVAAGALATAAAVVIMLRVGVMPWRAADTPELRALVEAVGTDRTIEPRLSGGFAYGPMHGAMRSADPSAVTVSPDVRIAAAEIEKRAIERRTPQNLHALGVAYLITGDVARAVPVLEEAADESSSRAQVLSDLAAAYLVRATRDNQPQDLAKALAAADRAVKADPKLAEAWFNRAYALERLSLTDEARQAWQDYLAQDSSHGWADEARAHLRAIGVVPKLRLRGNEPRP